MNYMAFLMRLNLLVFILLTYYCLSLTKRSTDFNSLEKGENMRISLVMR